MQDPLAEWAYAHTSGTRTVTAYRDGDSRTRTIPWHRTAVFGGIRIDRAPSPVPAAISAPRRVNGPSGEPRAAATRSSARSGDSGSEDSDPSEPPARRLTFADIRVAGAIAGISPHRQLRFFHALPERVQAAAWCALAEEVAR